MMVFMLLLMTTIVTAEIFKKFYMFDIKSEVYSYSPPVKKENQPKGKLDDAALIKHNVFNYKNIFLFSESKSLVILII